MHDFWHDIKIGAVAHRELNVSYELTAQKRYSGLPAVFATAEMILLMESASADALIKFLPQGWVSVGMTVDIEHLAASPVGRTVNARAKVLAVNGKVVTFWCEAKDDFGLVGQGVHKRGLVKSEKFLEKLRNR